MKIQCFALSLSVLLLSVAARGDNELDPESRKNSRVGEPTMLNSLITAQDLLAKSKHLTAPTRPPPGTSLSQYAPQNTHGFYYSPFATSSPLGSGYLLSMPAQHNSVLASESFTPYCPKYSNIVKPGYGHPNSVFSDRNAHSPLGMNYGLQYVQLVPRPMVLPYNPYSQYSSMPQPQPYLSHSQTQQTSASNHHPQTQSSPQFLNSVPPTQQTAASMTIASPVNHHYVPYSPPLQSQQQPVASYSSPMVSYFSPPPAARFHYAAHPQEMTLNTNEYMPGQLENGFRAIKRV